MLGVIVDAGGYCRMLFIDVGVIADAGGDCSRRGSLLVSEVLLTLIISDTGGN
jgi:hypothetical protein